jgi:hypothetical protein
MAKLGTVGGQLEGEGERTEQIMGETSTVEAPARTTRTRRPSVSAGAGRGSSMEKGLCWGALALTGILTLVFLLDMFSGFPFAQASIALDVFAVLAGGVLIYLCIDTLRELR